AMSHDRIIVIEVMGHRAGWIALGAGLAGGADIILIPEIPYDVEKTVKAIMKRKNAGKMFSIVVVAEGAMSKSQNKAVTEIAYAKERAKTKEEKNRFKEKLVEFHKEHLNHTLILTKQLEKLVKMESRLTILGHLQRGGTPSAYDRIVATRLGTAATQFIAKGNFGIMVALKEEKALSIPIENVAGKINFVPLNHPWIESAKETGIFLGD
ncbi:MAG: 6-phosphofructokinase, partial [Acidobacteria bacterium]|nr:6-phosphofructokinase [Acidobacteriota bacterium]